MRSGVTQRRAQVLVAVLLVALVCIAARAVHVYLVIADQLMPRFVRQHGYREVIPAPPGDIVDRRGRLLATSRPVYSLFLNPRAVPKEYEQGLIPQIAAALGMDPARLVERIETNRDRYFLWVKRRLTEQELLRLRRLELDEKVFGFRREYTRVYPRGPLAAHVIGLRDIDMRARSGAELAFDRALRGVPGVRIVRRDAAGRPLRIEIPRGAAPRRGGTVQLTIDIVIQRFAEEALEEVARRWEPRGGGACVVMDPGTGEVLAMASWPGYDPNRPGEAPAEAWLNRCIGAIYEPGSTFKPFIAAAALNWGVVSPDDVIDCHNGVYRMGGRVLHSHHPYGLLPFPEVIVRSDNIGMAVIGERLGIEGTFRAVHLFGFGRPTGIELPGEVSGRVLPFHLWNLYSLGSVPMGHEIGVTPIQLATAFCALANGGWLLRPTIVRSIRDADGRIRLSHDGPEVVRRVVRTEVARYLVDEVLFQVVESRHGTGRRARLKDYTVFGKTGTAQKPDPGGKGYLKGRHISSFVGGAPIGAPQVVAYLVVDDPAVPGTHYGGEVAAPAVAKLLERTLRYLGVPPDRPSRSTTLADRDSAWTGR